MGAESVPDSGVEEPVSISSVVKLQRIHGRQGLEDVQQLPSIWTPKIPGNIGDCLEQFYLFRDMRPARGPDSSRGARQRPAQRSKQRCHQQERSAQGYAVGAKLSTATKNAWPWSQVCRICVSVVAMKFGALGLSLQR